jgi:hypothetical protein
MPSATRLFYWEGIIVVGGLFGVIAWRLFTGGITLRCLLRGDRIDRRSPTGYSSFFSPGRAQMLVVTVLLAGYYLIQVMHDPTTFPKMPTSWVVALGSSHAIYLGGKVQSMLLGVRDLMIDRRKL